MYTVTGYDHAGQLQTIGTIETIGQAYRVASEAVEYGNSGVAIEENGQPVILPFPAANDGPRAA